MPGTTVIMRAAISRMGSGPPFAPQDAEHVVLLRRQAEVAKQPGEANLELVGRAEEVEHRLLLGQVERPSSS